MKFIEATDLTADRLWGTLDVVTTTGATSVRFHWSDQPYKWHIDDGEEVFVAADGAVDMHYRDAGQECVRALTPGTIYLVEAGDEHVARLQGEARIFVIEKEGSA